MRILMPGSSRRKWVKLAVAVVAVTGICLLISGKALLYGQLPNQRIPDMTGVWSGELSFCLFDDVGSSGYDPECLEGEPAEPFRVTDQRGRLFAGREEPPGPPNYPGRLTGVVLPDGGVSIQFYEGGLRIFYTGTLTIRAGKYELVGYAHAFDDLRDLNESPDNNMATGTFYLTKVY